MRKILIILFSLSLSFNALAWGQTGHRVTGAIAEHYLTPSAQAAIDDILPDEDLAEAATYPDEMRSSPKPFWQNTAGPFHYVTIPVGKRYADVAAPLEGDAITALKRFRQDLKDPLSSLATKQLALRFIVHIIGDLHQPLHAGNGIDKGGNEVKVKFFWQDSNLHRVWDSGMIDQRQLSYTEWTKRLKRKINQQDISQWTSIDPHLWISESSAIRERIYPQSQELSWDYLFSNLPIATRRLQMGGVRIAAYLNEIFQPK